MNNHPPSSGLLTEELALTDTELWARVFRPDRSRFGDAVEAALGIEDPAEVWETLAARGFVPAEWLGDGERVFAEDERPPALAERGFNDQPTYAAMRRYLEEGPRLVDLPPNARAACTIACDVTGVTTAERVAREAVRRLQPWGAPQPTRVCWRIVEPESWETQPGDWRHWPAAMALGAAVVPTPTIEKNILRAHRYDFGTPRWRAAFTWENAALWRLLSANGRTFIASSRSGVNERIEQGGYPPIPAELREQPFSAVLNPFEPLLSLWASGYALDAITPSLIVLAAPVVAPERIAVVPAARRTRVRKR
jgi:hypothetical protein